VDHGAEQIPSSRVRPADTGGYTVEQLLERGHAGAGAGPIAKMTARNGWKKMGVEVVIGDFSKVQRRARGDARSSRAHTSVTRSAPGILQATAYFAQAAKEAGLECVVNMSQKPARRGRKEPGYVRSLVGGAGLRLVRPDRRPPAADALRRVAAVPRADDPRRGCCTCRSAPAGTPPVAAEDQAPA